MSFRPRSCSPTSKGSTLPLHELGTEAYARALAARSRSRTPWRLPSAQTELESRSKRRAPQDRLAAPWQSHPAPRRLRRTRPPSTSDRCRAQDGLERLPQPHADPRTQLHRASKRGIGSAPRGFSASTGRSRRLSTEPSTATTPSLEGSTCARVKTCCESAAWVRALHRRDPRPRLELGGGCRRPASGRGSRSERAPVAVGLAGSRAGGSATRRSRTPSTGRRTRWGSTPFSRGVCAA
jgi:hypothetical protein